MSLEINVLYFMQKYMPPEWGSTYLCGFEIIEMFILKPLLIYVRSKGLLSHIHHNAIVIIISLSNASCVYEAAFYRSLRLVVLNINIHFYMNFFLKIIVWT